MLPTMVARSTKMRGSPGDKPCRRSFRPCTWQPGTLAPASPPLPTLRLAAAGQATPGCPIVTRRANTQRCRCPQRGKAPVLKQCHYASTCARARRHGDAPWRLPSFPRARHGVIRPRGERPVVWQFSRCRRGRETLTKPAPHGAGDGSPNMCCSRRCCKHFLNPGARTRTRTQKHARMQPPARARLRVSVVLTPSANCRPHTHARAWSDGRARRQQSATLPIEPDRRSFTTFAARAVTPARAHKSPRPPNRVSSSFDRKGTVRISRWRNITCLRPHLANCHR